MLYIKNFKNYEEFKSIFGIIRHGNGAKSRNNSILLALLKDRGFFRFWLRTCAAFADRGFNVAKFDAASYLWATDMSGVKTFVKFLLGDATKAWHNIDSAAVAGKEFEFCQEFKWRLYSRRYASDGLCGLCADGDSRAIRYSNTERGGRIFKMKAGKFITAIIEEHECTRRLPEQVKRWIGEEFAREWQSYAAPRVGDGEYTLHVDDDFRSIYDSDFCAGDFDSCMTDKDYWTFYRDAVDASAAYLTNEDGIIVARCIIYNRVYDSEGHVFRLAERQYATDGDNILKQILVDRLIAGGYIDGYKRIGASCHDSHNFVTNSGQSMQDCSLYIRCHLSSGDTLSYQDSFKYYSESEELAYNYDTAGYDEVLDQTGGVYQSRGDNWSDYNECWITGEEAVRDDIYEDWIYSSQVCECIYNGHRLNGNAERLSHSYDYYWSDYEDAYIHDDECVYVDDDYRLKDDCVEDIDGKWQLRDDCHWSDYHGEYIHEDNAVWSRCRDSYLNEDDAYYCDYDDDWCPYNETFYSDITDDDYCSAESMAAAEADYRKRHALVPCNVA